MGTAHTGIYNRLSGGSEHLRSQEFRSWRLDLPCEMSFALFSFHPSFTSWHAFLIIILRVENRCVKINRARSNLLHYLNIVAFLFLTSVQFSSVAQLCPTLCDPMNCSTPGLPDHHQLPEFTQTHVHQVRDAIQPSHLCHPLLLLPQIPPSIRVFSNESTLHMRWPKYWSFSFNIIPSKEHP